MENIKELIKNFCNEEDYDYRDDYSGRGMYGTKCIGIICYDPLSTLAELFAYIIDSDDEICGADILDALGEPETDNMGMKMILYFPGLETE